MSQPSTAPGRDAPAPASTTTTTSAQEGAPATKDAGGGGPFGGGSWQMLILFAPLVLILFMSRNQSKKQKALEASLKVGDEVVTQSGMIGKIVDMDERITRLEIAPGVKVKVLKATVQGLAAPPPAEAKDDAKDKPQEKKA